MPGQNEHRQYGCALLEPNSTIKAADDAIRIESPTAEPNTSITKPRTERKVSPVPEPVTNPNGNAASNSNSQSNGHAKLKGQSRKTGTTKASQQDIAMLIEQAVKLRTALHDLMHQAGELVKSLKQHRRQSKVVETTLASIKQLKTLSF